MNFSINFESFFRLTFFQVLIVLNSSLAIDLTCNFVSYSIDGYNCKVENLRVDARDREVKAIKGHHLQGKRNWNVDTFYIPSADCVTYLPTGISRSFVNLKKFEVSYGSLKFISENDFSGFNFLQTISITKTLLSSIPEETFYKVPQLETLILSDNKIREMKLKLLEKLSSLKKLSMSGNSLEVLEAKLFERNLKIEEIDLSNNKLRVIDAQTFNPLKYLTKLALEGNFCTIQSFPKDVTLKALEAELYDKCTSDTEIVKSSKLTEMNHEIVLLQQSVNTSSETIKRLTENGVKVSLEIDKVESEKQEFVEKVQRNLTIANEKNEDLEARLEQAYKTVTRLKEDFDGCNEKCVEIKENCDAMKKEKVEENFDSAESSRFFIKTTHISSLSVLVLLMVTVAALAGNLILIIIIIRVKRNLKALKTNESEMSEKSAFDKQ